MDYYFTDDVCLCSTLTLSFGPTQESLQDLNRWQDEKKNYEVQINQLRSLLEEKEALEMDMSNIYSEENSATGKFYMYVFMVRVYEAPLKLCNEIIQKQFY